MKSGNSQASSSLVIHNSSFSSSRSIMIVSGEASGEMHGAALALELKKRHPDICIFGMGGDHMRAAGVEILTPLNPVVGLIEVIGHISGILRALKTLKQAVVSRRPDLIVLIDYPDFNLKIAAHAKKLGIKVMYYISPQVWAWRKGRVKTIASLIDAMAVILPFEQEIYEQEGVKCVYVGHPLIEELAGFSFQGRPDKEGKGKKTHKFLGIKSDGQILAFLPGSRRGEIERHIDLFLDTIKLIKKEYPDIQILVPIAATLQTESRLKLERLKNVGAMLVDGHAREVLSIADVALVASGTASLESALLGIPTVVFYKLKAFSYLIARLMVSIRYASLVNIILGREVIPEFIQAQATPANLKKAVLSLMHDNNRRNEMLSAFEAVKNELQLKGARASVNAADLAEELITGW